MTQTITLKTVATKFAKWRKSKTNKSEKIPKELTDLVLAIANNYQISKIAAKLRLSGSQIKKILNSNQIENFIELPYTSALHLQNDNNVTCELSRADGSSLKITILTAALPALIKGFLCCN